MTSGGELATRMFLLSRSTSFALSGHGSFRERPCQRRSFITSSYDRLTMLLFDRTRLEMLNLSQNRICSVSGLASVPSLVALNLGESESVQVGRLSASALRLIFAALDDSWAWAELP